MKKPRLGRHIPFALKMPLLTELKQFCGVFFYKYAAPTALSCPQKFQRFAKIRRQRRFKAHLLLRARMDERKLARVQHHARRGVTGQFLQPCIQPRAIDCIANQRMAKKLKCTRTWWVRPVCNCASTNVAAFNRSSTR